MKTEGGGPRLIIVCGLPGAGKTTRAKQLERALHAVGWNSSRSTCGMKRDEQR
jgi:tRNA uridine 5-carbamoylmethylation protein Kti12